jgi:hypothetical protein
MGGGGDEDRVNISPIQHLAEIVIGFAGCELPAIDFAVMLVDLLAG